MALHNHQPSNHSPLEGESASQEQSSQASRWGDEHSPQINSWMKVKRQYTQTAQTHAKNLRQNQPDAEHLLWHHLRHKQLAGYKFRRQQPIGKYIVDFVCMPEKLIIELDGSQHAEQQNYDQQRDAFLKEEGYRVLRYWNNSLLSDYFAVLEDIFNHLVGVPATVPPPH